MFEYWTHALSYVPTRDLRFFIADMRLHRREGHRWFGTVTAADMRKVLRLVRKGGALTIRDIDDDVLVEKHHPWASRKPSKRALQLAFYTGAVTISERSGMLKTYELMQRHFGWDKMPRPASAAETSGYLLDRALRAQGIVSLDSVCYQDAPRKPAIRKLIEARVRRGELVPVALDGAGKQEHWARPDAIESRRPTPQWFTSSRRSTRSSSSASGRICFSITTTASKPTCPRKSGGSAISRCRSWSTSDIVAAIDLKTDRKKRSCWCRNGPGSAAARARP